MLKDIDISEYFELTRHAMKLDDYELWERDTILSNTEDGFRMIKCTSSVNCNKLAVAIMKIIIINVFLLLKILSIKNLAFQVTPVNKTCVT